LSYQHFKAEPNARGSIPGPGLTALVLFSAILVLALARLEGATVINANSASQSDVAAAIGSATNGDTIIIPAGTATWTRPLKVTKGITIQGAGTGVTIVKDGAQKEALIDWTLAAGYRSRLAGIEFQDGGRIDTANAPGGILHVDGLNTNSATFRLDNCKWNNLNGVPVFDTVIGVIDHNTFIQDRNQTAIYIYGSSWDGRSFGDGSWAAPTRFGSSQFLFIEDNTFTHAGSYTRIVTDAHAGARFVVRHNAIFDAFTGNHGTESTGRIRGSRAMEVYQNAFTGTNLNRFVGGSRSSTVLFHDNTISGFQADPLFTLGNFRNFFPFSPWGGADGTNAWDVNKPGAPFFSGSAASASVRTTVTVSRSPNWTTNQWAGYTIRRTSNLCTSRSLTFAEIVGNTSNTISYTDNGGYPTPSLAFCAGDTLEIRKVDHALDQPGRAVGSLITGDPPVRPSRWNDQVTEPCYAWNNGQASFSAGPGVRANVHYFDNTPMPGYTPYAYPHPLTKGLPPHERMTRNATETPQHNQLKKRQPWGGKKLDIKKAKKAKASPTNKMADGQDNVGN
jgi:hypothetical protein